MRCCHGWRLVRSEGEEKITVHNHQLAIISRQSVGAQLSAGILDFWELEFRPLTTKNLPLARR
jgi:hypothetical protein